jgi:hypothetical protein
MSTKKQNLKRKQRGEFDDIEQLAVPSSKKIFASADTTTPAVPVAKNHHNGKSNEKGTFKK